MMNPSKNGEHTNSPIERANKINDPDIQVDGGYYNYDLTHHEFSTPLFGQATPCLVMDTVPADRFVIGQDSKLIRNQINGNLLSTVNEYIDSFYVSLRNVFPTNYEKLIPNPLKGEDLPNTALPVVPLYSYFADLYRNNDVSTVYVSDLGDTTYTMEDMCVSVLEGQDLSGPDFQEADILVFTSRLLLLSTIISRGQLLDYLGFTVDTILPNPEYGSKLQQVIDAWFMSLWQSVYDANKDVNGVINVKGYAYKSDLTQNVMTRSNSRNWTITDLSTFRGFISDCLEAGLVPWIEKGFYGSNEATVDLINVLDSIFMGYIPDSEFRSLDHLTTVNSFAEMNSGSHINIGKVLAYQLIIAHYYSNDKVDNIYTSDLFMQNLRSVMFPTPQDSITTTEPTFDVNGVRYEYDYISYGGFWSSLLTDALVDGYFNRQYVFGTIMFNLKRTLRYGDLFASARVSMLAVSDQLGINVDGGVVSPIDVTKNLLLQRYLNCANLVGQNFQKYLQSLYGVIPSDCGVCPRFISHKKITIQNQITNNTADDQGAQTTNLVAYGDKSMMDVFIDDFGFLISIMSFDTLPIYKSGNDPTWYYSDRFDFYNPMMQNMGDVAIRSSELLSNPELYDDIFGWTVRNPELKFKNSRAHGAFVNDLPGFMISYPLDAYNERSDEYDIDISPDFIRDKPLYLDRVLPQQTGVSPAQYWHFICSIVNEVKCARKVVATPSILF